MEICKWITWQLYGKEWAQIIYHNQIKCDGVCFSRGSFPSKFFELFFIRINKRTRIAIQVNAIYFA